MRLVVLGAGRHSVATHGPALKILKARRPAELDLCAVCDLDREKAEAFARDFGFERVYQDVGDMIDRERPDALIAVTPLPLTEQIAADLIPRGIPILIEKPPGATSTATKRLLDLARKHGTPHMVSFNRRFNPAVLRAKQWIAESAEERRPVAVLGRMVRLARRESGFAVGTGIHLIDAVISILGPPRYVSCRKIGTAWPGCFFFNAHLEFARSSASIAILPSAGAREETLEIHGRDYTLEIDTFANRTELQQRNGGWTWTPAEEDRPDLLDVVAETEAFLAGVTNPERMAPTLADGLVSMRAAEAIQRGGVTEFEERVMAQKSLETARQL